MSNQKKGRNKEETIKKIYDTFFKLILENGYHHASTNKIAKGANISIGTLYHHFPKGKIDIIRNYFDKSVETTFNLEDFSKFDMNDIQSAFKGFIANVLNEHRRNKGYYMAFRSAIVLDKELSNAHKKRVYDVSNGIVEKLRESNEIFRSREKERLIRAFIFIYNMINAVIYHHIVFMDLFENDEDLIDYLSNMIAFTIRYLSSKP